MKVLVHAIPEEVRARNCVLIDALRATCTIVKAVHHGAKVRPVSSIEEALSYKGKAILAGERNSLKIDGFDIGNSPSEIGEWVRGKEIVLTTSNGTAALKKMKCGKIIAASFLNLPAVLEFVQDVEEVHVVCAGDGGRLSLEDLLLAGMIAKMDPDPVGDARVAAVYASSVRSTLEEVLKSPHAIELLEKGFWDDVAFCTKVGIYDEVPVLKEGVFTI